MAPNQRSLAGKENCASVFCPHVHALACPFLNRHALYYATPPRGKILTSSSSNVLFKHQYLKWLGWHHPCAAPTNYSPCQFPTHTHTHTHTVAKPFCFHTTLHFTSLQLWVKCSRWKEETFALVPNPDEWMRIHTKSPKFWLNCPTQRESGVVLWKNRNS
jgi:hypothetical protein